RSYTNYFAAWKINKTYHVVLKMHDGVGSVYVDGKSLLSLTLPRSFDEGQGEASHFYFGAYDEQLSGGKIHATVANVFLYNRPLNDTEIGYLNATRVPLPVTEMKPSTATSPSVEPVTTPAATTAQATAPVPTPAASQPTEEATSSGAGPSTPVGSTTTTSSAEEESVNQLASGTSPSTASTEGGVSGETAGGTDGQGIHSPDGEAEAAAVGLAFGSNLGNLSQRDDGVAGTVCGSRVLPLLLLGLWGF
ncbi:trans-sialidase, putative, partial [Trypanosoma cruzi marinkellei]